MGAVTPDMRGQRRLRREAERAARGEIRRRPPTPHPAGLRAQGWNRAATPTPAPGARLLGATTAAVAITDRATVRTASRATTPVALLPTPVTRGPLPAAASLPRPATFGSHPGDAAARPAAVPAPDPAPDPAPVGVDARAEVPRVLATAPAPAAAPAGAAAASATAPGSPAPSSATATPPAAVPAPSTGSAPATPDPAPAPAAASAGDRPEPPTTPAAAADPLPSDLFAHALGLSPANTPAPPAATTPGRHSRVGRRPRDPWADSGSGRRRRVLVAAAAAVVVLGGVGTAIGVTVAGRDDGARTSATAAADGVVADTATWLSGNVSGQQRIVTPDASLARDLNARGVPVDAVGSGTAPPTGAILVDSAAADTTPDAVTSTDGGESVVLLAVFTDPGGTVTVGEVVDQPAGEVRDDLDGARSTTASATEGLRNNAAVRIDTDAQPVFTSGRLDLRAATVLATIAQDQQVEVVSAPQDRAENRAGRPVRTIVVSVQDAQAVREIAATARSPYAPDVEAARAEDGAPAGSLRLTWPAGAAITKPFQ